MGLDYAIMKSSPSVDVCPSPELMCGVDKSKKSKIMVIES